MIYVRWRDGESRRGRVFNGFEPGDPWTRMECVLCLLPLGTEMVQLIAVGPHPDNAEAIERHRGGRWYAATAAVGHALCVQRADDARLDRLCTEELTLGAAPA